MLIRSAPAAIAIPVSSPTIIAVVAIAVTIVTAITVVTVAVVVWILGVVAVLERCLVIAAIQIAIA
jgi:hypothetical protein